MSLHEVEKRNVRPPRICALIKTGMQLGAQGDEQDEQDVQEWVLVLFSHKLYNHLGCDSWIQFISLRLGLGAGKQQRHSNEPCQLDYQSHPGELSDF